MGCHARPKARFIIVSIAAKQAVRANMSCCGYSVVINIYVVEDWSRFVT